jgi:hypothetical protein
MDFVDRVWFRGWRVLHSARFSRERMIRKSEFQKGSTTLVFQADTFSNNIKPLIANSRLELQNSTSGRKEENYQDLQTLTSYQNTYNY